MPHFYQSKLTPISGLHFQNILQISIKPEEYIYYVFHTLIDVSLYEVLQGTFLTTATQDKSYRKRWKFFKNKNIFFLCTQSKCSTNILGLTDLRE